MKKLSIIIPCFNEQSFIEQIIDKVRHVSLDFSMEKEIIVVDDASTDGTVQIVKAYIQKHESVKLILHTKNKGKGAAVQSALMEITGDIVIIQDADLEYDPADYNKMLSPIFSGRADVVYGSRFMGSGPHRVLFFWHTIGNKLLTFFSNVFTGVNLTDMETGYKMFKTEIIKSIQITEKRFGIEPEITAKICRIKDIRIYEVGVAYYGRKYNEGKKISWQDGFIAIWCILKYNLLWRK
ncbi:glycosyltransferase family 2 protein [Agriterribacter sp.]|uniref:glycosyltransferase family 2 protein n=1 Tax=Agriterribacter sp. TaxID=2821509 RepID=UPI002CFBA150|nr:glycosyltransferase family 2 protein [Agriterribacter sp.]HTN07501.1 glycosyltransferase family 2 protein [Agriterribacter sp.]